MVYRKLYKIQSDVFDAIDSSQQPDMTLYMETPHRTGH